MPPGRPAARRILSPTSYALEGFIPTAGAAVDWLRRLGVLLDAYWTSLAHDPLPALLLTGLLSLAGVLVVLLGHIVGDLVGQLLEWLR